MNGSATHPRAQGQDHDRDPTSSEDARSASTGEAGADDAMDTAPDTGELMNPTVAPPDLHVDQLTRTPPPTGPDIPNSTSREGTPVPSPQRPETPPTHDSITVPVPPPPNDEAPSSQTPPPPPEGNTSATPGSPRMDSANADGDGTGDDSSDEDDARPPWQEIKEDTSMPDERELKEIEAFGETSALDHSHWESKTFADLGDPEYTPGECGRIDWTVERYNGTAENPNKELVMKSQVVSIGGFDWQIKFYPKGNDSDYLSIYVDCVNLSSDKAEKEVPQAGEEKAQSSDEMMADGENPSVDSTELRHTPLPLWNMPPPPKRPSVAAQVAVVLYNPNEPRVNYFRTGAHRFCPASPDWGWTRFHGPHFEIQNRRRGQRQAMLRNDKLAFTGYVRIIGDETGCFAEHWSEENPWDSFAMTGLQGLSADGSNGLSGGNVVSALSSWMLLRPLRQLLYDVRVPDPKKEPRVRPKPVLDALQRLLYRMRTDVKPGSGPVSLERLHTALEWYGIDIDQEKFDVIEIWEILRARLEHELRDTPMANFMVDLFGAEKDRRTGIPSYKVPVRGVGSMQVAVDRSEQLVHQSQPLPQVLRVELDRQEYDSTTRKWKKLVDKVKLDDSVTVRGTSYTLFGFIVHKGNLQSGLYYSVLRPEGLGGKWYSYKDGKDGNRVVCLTTNQALEAHEGYESPEDDKETAAVAYIVLYVRNDIADSIASQGTAEPWDAPESAMTVNLQVPQSRIGEPSSGDDNTQGSVTKNSNSSKASVKLQIMDSRLFLQHEGPGTIDTYDPKWSDKSSEFVHDLVVEFPCKPKELVEKVAALLKDVKDPRQCLLWSLFSPTSVRFRPDLHSPEVEFDEESKEKLFREFGPELRAWVHVIPFDDLPPLPEQTAVQHVVEVANPTVTDDQAEQAAVPTIPGEPSVWQEQPVQENSVNEDTVMSDPEDEPAPEEAVIEVVVDNTTTQNGPTEILVPPPPPPPPPMDTEMSGIIQLIPPPPLPMDIPPPPQPPGQLNVQIPTSKPRLPPEPGTLAHDQTYFFLKTFHAETQKLSPVGSFVVRKTDRVDHVVTKLLDLPRKTQVNLYDEDRTAPTAYLIRPRCTFGHEALSDSLIIIAAIPPSDEVRAELASRAAFAEVSDYLAWWFESANHPGRVDGHFTFDYFSSEPYTGTVRKGHRHGLGKHISFAGHVYSGRFVLGNRHGLGLMTYANGDVYDGEWVDGQRHGQGSFLEATTGNKYVGGWRKHKRFGEGVTQWKAAQETERLCRICWESSAEAVFYDCGHVLACLECAKQVDQCPVCRKRVLLALKLFYAT